MRPKIYPVIHHLNETTTLAEAALALTTPGVDGVFLISHDGSPDTDGLLLRYAMKLKAEYPDKAIGINCLATQNKFAIAASAVMGNLDMVWFDSVGVNSGGVSLLAQAIEELMCDKAVMVFAGVAFKYQKPEPNPAKAAGNARMLGFIPTTSGPATGAPPPVEKLRVMSREGLSPLAVASGMTPENVGAYVPYLSHILVSTGVSRDEHHLDLAKLAAFVNAVDMAVA